MKIISADKIKNAVSDLCVRANLVLRGDVLGALKSAYLSETNNRAKRILEAIIRNASIAQKEKIAICQDTGLPYVFAELGNGLHVRGDLIKAINAGVEAGYRKASLRNSVVRNPLQRARPVYTPAVIHIDAVKGDKLKLTVFPKGFGAENKSQIKMFNPTAAISEIRKFILEAVKAAGPDACPPYVVGVGIGGTADYAMYLSKKALLRRISKGASGMERALLKEINNLNIGPMGLGGKTTCLGVNVETYPTHIAGLPVAVNISCHALRSATAIL